MAGTRSPQTKVIKIGEGKEGLVDFAVLPEPSDIRVPQPDDINTQVSFGDLHGCVVSAAWQTYRLGSIKYPKEKFDKLCKIYLEHHPLDEVAKALESSSSEEEQTSTESGTSSDDEFTKIVEKYLDAEKEFDSFLESIEVVNKELTVEFRGDDTGDRGAEDEWTGKFIKKLIDLGLKIKIMFSNHGAEYLYFVYCLLRDENFELNELTNGLAFVPVQLSDEKEYTMSLQNMAMLIMLKIIDRKTIVDFVENYYLPNLYLIDVLRDTRKEEAVTYITHAPNIPKNKKDLHLIKLANFFKVTCDIEDTKSHPDVADQINVAFRNWWKTTPRDEIKKVLQDKKHIIHKTIWSREVALPAPHPKPRHFGFGHTEVPEVVEQKDKKGELAGIDSSVWKGDTSSGVLRQSTTTFFQTPKKAQEPKELIHTPIPQRFKSRRAKRVAETIFVPGRPDFDEGAPQPSGATQPSKDKKKK